MMFTRLASQIFNTIRPVTSTAACSSWSTGLFQQAGKSIESIAGGPWGTISVRTNVRCHFPRAREVKRVKRHGYKTRMATPSGREILMRRILKGRFVLSH